MDIELKKSFIFYFLVLWLPCYLLFSEAKAGSIRVFVLPVALRTHKSIKKNHFQQEILYFYLLVDFRNCDAGNWFAQLCHFPLHGESRVGDEGRETGRRERKYNFWDGKWSRTGRAVINRCQSISKAYFLSGTKNGICRLKKLILFIQVVLSRAVRNNASVFRRYRSPLHRLCP